MALSLPAPQGRSPFRLSNTNFEIPKKSKKSGRGLASWGMPGTFRSKNPSSQALLGNFVKALFLRLWGCEKSSKKMINGWLFRELGSSASEHLHRRNGPP